MKTANGSGPIAEITKDGDLHVLPNPKIESLKYEQIDGSTVELKGFFEDAVLNENYYACFKNDMVTAKQLSTLREAKLLRLIISQVLMDATDLRSYKIKVTDLADLLELSPSTLYRDAKKICESLHTKYISIQRPDGTWENLSWITRSFYDNAYIHITLSDQLKPYLLDLHTNFVQIQVKEFTNFHSFYGLRVYECLKAEWGRRRRAVKRFVYDIDTLRNILDGENKLKTFSHFKDRALTPAVESINKNKFALFTVEMELIKGRGKSIEKAAFTITPKDVAEEELTNDVL